MRLSFRFYRPKICIFFFYIALFVWICIFCYAPLSIQYATKCLRLNHSYVYAFLLTSTSFSGTISWWVLFFLKYVFAGGQSHFIVCKWVCVADLNSQSRSFLQVLFRELAVYISSSSPEFTGTEQQMWVFGQMLAVCVCVCVLYTFLNTSVSVFKSNNSLRKETVS